MRSMRKTLQYNVIFCPEPEGGYTVVVPALPGCVTYGKTLLEARRMAKDAVSAYIASLRKHREAVPDDEESLVSAIEYSYA